MQPTLVVLAAGMGSRYGGVKQIDPVGPSGEAIIDFSIYDAIAGGFDRVIFVVRPEIEDDVRAFFAGKFEGRIRVDYCHQRLDDVPEGFTVPDGRAKPWGTAHAVLAARSLVDAPFAVINGDDFYGRDALATMAAYLAALDPSSTDYAMVGYRLDRTLSQNGTVSRGIVSHDAEGWLTSIVEHTRLAPRDGRVVSLAEGDAVRDWFSGDEPTSMNLFGFGPQAIPQFEQEFASFLEERGTEPKSEFFIPLAVDRLRASGSARMQVLRSDGEWFGVTYRDDRPGVVARLQQLADGGGYPSPLWQPAGA